MIQRARPLGFQNLSSLASATGLTPPALANFALISCSGGSVNWRDDGTAPTGAAGGGVPMLDTSAPLEYGGTLGAIQFIQQSGSTSSVQVAYYVLVG
jgi:hypothetical protein